MKKGIIIGIICLVVLIIGGLLLRPHYTEDEINFKKEYEKFNNKKTAEGKKYLNVDIIKDNNIKYKTAEEVIKSLQNDTAVIYFGFPECPWCRNLVTVLLEATKEKKYSNIYANILSIRDQKHLDEEGNIVVDKEGTEEYKKIVEILGNNLGEYEGLNDPSIKRLYFPTVVFVSAGEVKAVHIGTVDSQKDPYIKLDKKQHDELLKIFKQNIELIESKTCSGVNKC